MPEHIITAAFSNSGTRNEVRMRVVNRLSEEECGQGRDDLASRYTYFVEQLNDGKRVYLRRPANLHNGFDFIVCVEDINFNANGRRRNYPTHDDIINDLRDKYTESQTEYSKLFALMKTIYLCQDIDFTLIKNITFTIGYPCDLILNVLKWLFIEQDIRYWNYSGREMLWNGINTVN